MNNRSFRFPFFVSYGGIVAALGLTLLYLSALLPGMELSLAAAAGILLSIVVIKCSKSAAFGVYIVVSVLGFLLVPNKGSVLLFTIFLGYYPILKAIAENCKNKIIQWAIKLISANIAVLAILYFFSGIVTIPEIVAGKIYYLIPAANLVFIVYDFAFSGVIQLMVKRLKL